jgi:hypothetical protein
MRIAITFCLLALVPGTIAAQRAPTLTLSGGMATAWRGSGPSGSVRVEVPTIALLRDVRVLWGGSAWLAQTAIPGSPFELKRNLRGIGPSVGLGWRPGGSDWQLAVHSAVEVLHSGRQDVTFPAEETSALVGTGETHGTSGAAAFSVRVSTPSGGGTAFEVGAVVTRHGIGEGGWWSRIELGLRFGVGGR